MRRDVASQCPHEVSKQTRKPKQENTLDTLDQCNCASIDSRCLLVRRLKIMSEEQAKKMRSLFAPFLQLLSCAFSLSGPAISSLLLRRINIQNRCEYPICIISRESSRAQWRAATRSTVKRTRDYERAKLKRRGTEICAVFLESRGDKLR
jgi:hypothetical protein